MYGIMSHSSLIWLNKLRDFWSIILGGERHMTSNSKDNLANDLKFLYCATITNDVEHYWCNYHSA